MKKLVIAGLMAMMVSVVKAGEISAHLDDVAADLSATTQRYFMNQIEAGYADRAQFGTGVDRTGNIRIPLAGCRGFYFDSSVTLDSGGLQQFDFIFPVRKFKGYDLEANVFRNGQYEQFGFGVKAVIKLR